MEHDRQTSGEIGFKSLKSDPCGDIYSDCDAIYSLTLYVDDVLLLGKDVLVLRRIKQKLMITSQ